MTNLKRLNKGSQIIITATATDNTGAALDITSSTVTFTIAETVEDTPIVEFNTTPQIVKTSPASGIITITLNPSDLMSLGEDINYRYDLWTEDSGGANRLHQEGGTFRLRGTVEPN